jgi:hypothetical protein
MNVLFVMPLKNGIQAWIPAFAGMTRCAIYPSK